MILAGAFLLCLPISSADHKATNFIDALFTATTSVCVTGLVTVPTAEHWSLFGKVIILLLIQFGGLGIMACMMMVYLIFHRRVSLYNRKLIQDTYNLPALGEQWASYGGSCWEPSLWKVWALFLFPVFYTGIRGSEGHLVFGVPCRFRILQCGN